MRTGTRWTTRKGLVWGLGVVVAVVGGVAAAVPVPGEAEQVSIFPVEVIGPGFAQPGDECLFRAVPQGGTSPFTYHWDPPASGTDDFAWATMPQTSDPVDVDVRVTVLDATGDHGAGIISVNVDPSNDPCGI